MAFAPPVVIVVWLKRLANGGSRAPQDPLLATPILIVIIIVIGIFIKDHLNMLIWDGNFFMLKTSFTYQCWK